MKPTIRQLEYVVALADTLSFRRAAERCLVSQPSLSAQLQEVEKLLGVRLFERDRRKVLVTPAGQQVIDSARQILAEVEDLVEVAAAMGRPFSGSLRMGVIPTVAPYLLPRVVPSIRKKYPKLRLLLHEGLTHELVDRLARGELDLLLLALEAELGELITLPLFDDPFLVALSDTHELASHESVDAADLEGREMLLLSDGHCLRGQTEPICNSAGACELGDVQATSLSTLMEMVSAGIGITLLPQLAVEHEMRARKSIVVRPFVDTAPSRTIGLAWRPTSPRGESFRELSELLTQ